MNISIRNIPPGVYVVAISGGVDSMVLLDMLAKQSKSPEPSALSLQLVVAHFNHGIRSDSDLDEKLVKQAAKRYGLPIRIGRGNLGLNASEDKARRARYKFLGEVRDEFAAKAVITAHHQDDLIETAIINMLRGTGPRGLVAITDNPRVIRPLLNVAKAEILAYGRKNSISWYEDKSNQSPGYLRNRIRSSVMPKLGTQVQQRILGNIKKVAKNSNEVNTLIASLSHKIIKNNQINRHDFIMLPPEVASQLIMYWLRGREVREIDKKLVTRLETALRAARAGTTHKINDRLSLHVSKQTASFASTLKSA